MTCLRLCCPPDTETSRACVATTRSTGEAGPGYIRILVTKTCSRVLNCTKHMHLQYIQSRTILKKAKSRHLRRLVCTEPKPIVWSTVASVQSL